MLYQFVVKRLVRSMMRGNKKSCKRWSRVVKVMAFIKRRGRKPVLPPKLNLRDVS